MESGEVSNIKSNTSQSASSLTKGPKTVHVEICNRSPGCQSQLSTAQMSGSHAYSSLDSDERAASVLSSPYASEAEVGDQSHSAICLHTYRQSPRPASLFHSTGQLTTARGTQQSTTDSFGCHDAPHSGNQKRERCNHNRPQRRLLSDEERRRKHHRRLQRQAMSLDFRPKISSPSHRRRQATLLKQTTVEVPEGPYLSGFDMESNSLSRCVRNSSSAAWRSGGSIQRTSMSCVRQSTDDINRKTRRSNTSLANRKPGSAFSVGSTSLLNLNAAEAGALVTPMLPVLAMAVRQRETITKSTDKRTSRRMRWAVIITGLILLTASVVMVGVTLKMAPLIDDMVRRENEEFYGRHNTTSDPNGGGTNSPALIENGQQ